MYVPGFCIHSGDLNTGPHTWAASTLPLEPFLPPHPHSFLWDGINTVKERKSRSPVPDSEMYAGTWRVTQLFELQLQVHKMQGKILVLMSQSYCKHPVTKYKGRTSKIIWHVIKGLIVSTVALPTVSLLCPTVRGMFDAIIGDICACSSRSALHEAFYFLITSLWSCVKGRADVPLKKRVLRYETHKFTFSILMLLHSTTYCSQHFFMQQGTLEKPF